MSLSQETKNHINDYLEPRLHSKTQANEEMIREINLMCKNFNVVASENAENFKKHIEEDAMNFGSIHTVLAEIKEHISDSNDFMASLKPLSDVFKGGRLLSKPSMWILGLILGIVAFTGGLKALLLTIASWLKF